MTTTVSGPIESRALRLPPVLHYLVHSTVLTMRNVSFVMFSVGLPVLLYLVFSQVFTTGDAADNAEVSAMIMVSMAAYGSMGAAMSGGAQLALERRSGWFRQLTVTALRPRSFLWAKAGVIMLIVLPSLILVFGAGAVIGGVRLTPLQWIVSPALMWLGLLPLTALGIAIGLWVKAEAVQGVTTLSLLLLAMLGGLWFPAQYMPGPLQAVAHALPSYWLAEFGRWAILPASTFPWLGVVVMLAWSVVLTVLGGLGYRRAVAASKR